MAETQPRDQSAVLASVDANRQMEKPQSTLVAVSDKEKVKPAPAFTDESKQHRSLHARILAQEKSGRQAGAYVSPSDDLMSPASAKLNALKQRRLQKTTAKPRTLFATQQMRPDSSHSESQ